MVVTFLALLEMTRLHMTRLYQTDSLGALHVTLVLVDVDPAELSARDDYQ
jgi:chromatin segregation and condensation protein Rec8/ScpA/Scc1 (kleisin family)